MKITEFVSSRPTLKEGLKEGKEIKKKEPWNITKEERTE